MLFEIVMEKGNDMFKKSKLLTDTENRKLEILESLSFAAPLSKAKYDEYVSLCRKAKRKPHAETI